MLINHLSFYKADIVALQMIGWTGSGILEKRDCTPFYHDSSVCIATCYGLDSPGI